MREPRCYFNPCEWNGLIFVCGSGSIEAFSPQTNCFLDLLLSHLPENSGCLYVQDNLLVVHSSMHISRIAMEQAGQLVLHDQTIIEKSAMKWSNSLPVVDPARCLCFIIQQDKCLSFSMESGEEKYRFV